ncbi:hypothetical protein R6Q59_020212 [Mikania micrantha]
MQETNQTVGRKLAACSGLQIVVTSKTTNQLGRSLCAVTVGAGDGRRRRRLPGEGEEKERDGGGCRSSREGDREMGARAGEENGEGGKIKRLLLSFSGADHRY